MHNVYLRRSEIDNLKSSTLRNIDSFLQIEWKFKKKYHHLQNTQRIHSSVMILRVVLYIEVSRFTPYFFIVKCTYFTMGTPGTIYTFKIFIAFKRFQMVSNSAYNLRTRFFVAHLNIDDGKISFKSCVQSL